MLGPGRVLVVEDSDGLRRMLVMQLETAGYRVDAVGDGLSALEALDREGYGIVLMDIGIPGLDGLETARRIRRGYTAGKPYLVALTGEDDPGFEEECIRAGFNDVRRKPLPREELLNVVADALVQGDEKKLVEEEVAGLARGVLDLARLARLENDAPAEMVAGLVRDLYGESVEHVDHITQCVIGERLDECARVAHKLKSVAWSYGAMQIRDLARDVELGVKFEDVEGLRHLTRQLRDACAHTDAALKVYLGMGARVR